MHCEYFPLSSESPLKTKPQSQQATIFFALTYIKSRESCFAPLKNKLISSARCKTRLLCWSMCALNGYANTRWYARVCVISLLLLDAHILKISKWMCDKWSWRAALIVFLSYGRTINDFLENTPACPSQVSMCTAGCESVEVEYYFIEMRGTGADY